MKEQSGSKGKTSNSSNCSGADNKDNVSITPSIAIVVGGLLLGVLEVTSLLVDKDQTIEIVLTGSLRQKTELEKMLDQVGSMRFDDVIKALIERL
jgi:ATP:corrinoid adenosyltransferase